MAVSSLPCQDSGFCFCTSHAPNKYILNIITKTTINLTKMASGHNDHYYSDDSTFSGARKPRRRRDSAASDTNYARSQRYGRRRRRTSAPHADEEHSATSTLGKVALGVIFVQVVSTCFSMWMSKKDDEKYKTQRHQDRRREFEKAKAKRRRDEDRFEREEEERERKEAARWEREEIITEGRRIGYVESPSIDSEESEERAPRQIEAPPESDRRDDRGRSRAGSIGGKSFDARSTRGKSTAGNRDADRAERDHGRSRSRPRVNVR